MGSIYPKFPFVQLVIKLIPFTSHWQVLLLSISAARQWYGFVIAISSAQWYRSIISSSHEISVLNIVLKNKIFCRIFHLPSVVGRVFHARFGYVDEYSLGVVFTERFLNATSQCPACYRFDIIREVQHQCCEGHWEVVHGQETQVRAYDGDLHNTTAQNICPREIPTTV